MFRRAEKATVRLTYRGDYAGNNLHLTLASAGGKNRSATFAEWNPLLETLERSWSVVRQGNTRLFRRPGSSGPSFASVDDFLREVPRDNPIGQYQFDASASVAIPDYTPAADALTVPVTVRGPHTLRTYVGANEDLEVRFTMQDSNRNLGRDDLTFRIYRGFELLYEQRVKDEDDGSEKTPVGAARDVEVRLQAPGPGTYRIEITATSEDQFFRSITTKQKYIAWDQQMFLAGGSEYRELGNIEEGPITVYVRGTTLTVSTPHVSMLQTLLVNRTKLILKDVHAPHIVDLPDATRFVPVTIPKRDVLLQTDGTIVFDPSQAFSISAEHIDTLTNSSNPDPYDYVVATYTGAKPEGEWLAAEKSIKGDFGREMSATLSFLRPDGVPGEILQVKSLEITLHLAPLTWTNVWNGILKIFHRR